MADVKISGLPASTTPLAGTEVLPIVQGGQTRQVSVTNLTAGKAVSALNFQPTGSTVPTNGVYLPAANAVGVATNSTNAIYIDSSQNVGIGTVPSAKFHVAGAINATTDLSVGSAGGTKIITLGNPAVAGAGFINIVTATAFNNWQIAANQYVASSLCFVPSTATGGTTFTTPSMTLLANGNVELNTGNLVIGTAGKGIDFSATPGTGTSELLADYEEGTWTPVPKDSSGDQPTSFFVLEGRYTKIGRIVTATAFMSINVAGSFGEFSTVENLPFTVANFGNGFSRYGASFSVNTATNVRADGGPFAFENSTVITVGGTTGGSTGQQLHMTIVYQAA